AAITGRAGVMGIAAGDVGITVSAALETVTVDGYGDGEIFDATSGTNDALATINLSNGEDFDISSAAATLALNLTNVDGVIDVQAGTKDLTATLVDSEVWFDSASVE